MTLPFQPLPSTVGSHARRGSATLVLSLFLVTVLSMCPPAAALETIGTDTSRTVVVDMNTHDAYELTIGGGGSASIAFTADSNVDFYVMSSSDYFDYLDPNASSFGVRDSAEVARSFSYSTAESGLIFVVDNDAISVTGASPTGPVSYVLTVRFEGGPTYLSIAVAIVAGVAVFSIIGFAVLRARRRRATASAPPMFQGPQPEVPPPPQYLAGSPPTITQTAGATRRPMTPPEQDLLIRDLKDQRARVIVGATVGLVLAIAYNVFPNLMTLGLSIIAFIAPAIAAGIVKLRRAIMAGQMMEMTGLPAVLGNRQGFVRLQFGPESMWVSASLYGRLTPNQTNRLAVLPGAGVVVAVNGLPLPKAERVRIEGGGRAAAGWS